MPKHIKLRTLTEEEAAAVRQLARSRTAAQRSVQRAQIIVALLDAPTLHASRAGRRAGYRSRQVGPLWVKRFNADGLDGLTDRPRSGCPPTHSETVKSQLLDLVLQKPRSLAYPFELWTLERLQTAFLERHNVYLSDSTIWTWVEAEGLCWKRQQSWFHDAEHHDPEFVEKRGP